MKTNTGGKPTANGTKIGQTVKTEAAGAMGSKYQVYYQWDGSEWNSITKAKYLESTPPGTFSYKTVAAPTLSSATGSRRYPRDAAMTANSDYVLFEFFEYQPPFQNINKGATKDSSTPLATYNESVSAERLYKGSETEQSIILYMPEDVSTGYKANWSGKAFSNIGRDALTTAGSGDFGQGMQNALTTAGTAFSQAVPNLGNKVIRDVISKITGESLSQNDVFGATRGVILNPNVELLFTGTDLRNISLNYKLVPRNALEATEIKEICKIFKRSMLPKFSKGTELNFSKGQNAANNFIKVPNVCRLTFMRGNGPNPDVAQYKMCAMTNVEINYTPDGTYATYDDGSMVAIGLSLSFQETKLIFSEEADKY